MRRRNATAARPGGASKRLRRIGPTHRIPWSIRSPPNSFFTQDFSADSATESRNRSPTTRSPKKMRNGAEAKKQERREERGRSFSYISGVKAFFFFFSFFLFYKKAKPPTDPRSQSHAVFGHNENHIAVYSVSYPPP